MHICHLVAVTRTRLGEVRPQLAAAVNAHPARLAAETLVTNLQVSIIILAK